MITTTDYTIENHGTVALLYGNHPVSQYTLAQDYAPDDAQWHGGSLAFRANDIPRVVAALEGEGWTVNLA